MQSLRSRLILSHILPLALTLPLVGVALIYILETQVLLTEMSAGISERAELIAEVVNGQPDVLADSARAEALVNRLGVHIDGQILLFSPSGELLASSDDLVADLSGLEQARAGETSTTVIYGLFAQRVQVFVPVQDINQQLIGIVGVTETLSGMAEQFGRLRGWILVVLLIELALGAWIGFVLATRLERPISRSSQAVVEIARGREIEPLPEEGPRETRALAHAVNDLAERLRLLEETRRRSLANIVHELGRPLGAIRSAVHVLRDSLGEDPEIREELLAGVEQEIERMQPLLDDLAQLHGQVQGTIQLNLRPVNLREWLPPTLLPWRAAALEKNLQWRSTISPDLPILEIDPDRLAQTLGNLLSNAIKYTPEGGQVMVSAGVDADSVWIVVADNGPGILAAEQTRVFEPFYRSSQLRRFPQGLGIGLTLAQEQTRAQGGEITLESTPNEGSRFTIHLPRPAASA